MQVVRHKMRFEKRHCFHYIYVYCNSPFNDQFKRITFTIEQLFSFQPPPHTILGDVVIPFLKKRKNVLDVKETTFLHDKAPCMKAIATQQMLRSNKVDFFDNSQWPGLSPDLNVTENLGAILKDRVEASLSDYTDTERLSADVLLQTIEKELKDMAKDTELFETLLRSYPSRLEEVRKENGYATKY